MTAPRTVILISGKGSNMAALISACADGRLPGTIAAVFSNQPQAEGLGLAQAAGIPTRGLDHRAFPDRETFDAALAEQVADHNPDLVALAGFMRVLTPVFVAPFGDRLMNIHPSLLPRYPGLNTHRRAIDNGDTEAGATVHYVTGTLDGGPGILQARVPVEPGDSAEQLAARVLPVEHQIYPVAARWHLEGRLTLHANTATLDGDPLPPGGLQWSPH